jgi:hypothetical protein
LVPAQRPTPCNSTQMQLPLQVPRAGIEPACLSAPPPQDGVSTNSTTWANIRLCVTPSAPAAPGCRGVLAQRTPWQQALGPVYLGVAAGAAGAAGVGVAEAGAGGAACVAGVTAFAAARAATDVLIPWKDRASEVRKKRPAQTAVTRLRKVTAPRPPKALVAAPPPRAAPMPASFPGWRRMTKIMKTHRRTWTAVKKASIGPRTLQKARGA